MGDTVAEAVLSPAVLLQRASFLHSLEAGIQGGGGDVVPLCLLQGLLPVERKWKGREESLLGCGRARAWHLVRRKQGEYARRMTVERFHEREDSLEIVIIDA